MIKKTISVDGDAVNSYLRGSKMRAECAGCGCKIKKDAVLFQQRGNFCKDCCSKMRNKDKGGVSITKIIYNESSKG